MSRRLTIAVTVSLVVTLTAETAAAQDRIQQRDSAGVRITTQRPGTVVPLAVASARFTRDGTEGSREPFHRVNGVVALRHGIVVANAGTYELRYYGRDGSLRAVAGRRGSGPGEFRLITWIQAIPGDSVLAYDAPQRRMSVWTNTGEHVRDMPVALPRGRADAGSFIFPPSPLGMFSDREFFYIGSVSIRPDPGLQRATGYLVRANLAAPHADTITRVPVMDMDFSKEKRGSRRRQVAFPRMLTYAFDSGAFAISDGAEYRIDRYSRSGRLTSSIRVQREPATISARDRELYILAEEVEEPADVVFGSKFPAYGPMWYDRQGRLWAELYRPLSAGDRQWDVFDEHDRLIVTVSAPAALKLVAADATQVYAIHSDEFDVSTLRAFELPAALKR